MEQFKQSTSKVFSKQTLVGSFYRLTKHQGGSKFKYRPADMDYDMELLNPYPAGDWIRVNPREEYVSQMHELVSEQGMSVSVRSKDEEDKEIGRPKVSSKRKVREEDKGKKRGIPLSDRFVIEDEDSEDKERGSKVSSKIKVEEEDKSNERGTLLSDISKVEEDKDSINEEKVKFEETEDHRYKINRILRGPMWNYGTRKLSSDLDYYNHIIFGVPWASSPTSNVKILRGAKWVPSKKITVSLARLILGRIKKMGEEKTALVELETSRMLTYGELARKVDSIACGLHWLGVQPKQIMAIVSYHSLEAHIMLLACLKVGAVAALVDSSLNAVDLGIVLRITGPNLLFTEMGTTLYKVEAAISYLEISLHNPKPLLIMNSTTMPTSTNYILFSELLKEVNPSEPIPGPRKADPLRPIMILYTGSEDKMRACLISERHYTYSMPFVESVLPDSDEPSITVMVTPPMYCALAIKTVMNHYFDGHRIVLCRGPVPEPCLITALRKYEVFAFLTIRSTLMSLLDWPARPRCPHLKLAAVTGVPLRLKNLTRVAKELFKDQVQILQLWGLVETGTAAANTFLQNKQGSVGKLFYNVELKVLEEGTGIPLGFYQEGELCVRSPTMMLGYYNNPVANEQMIDSEDFVHTGELGYYDEQGFVFKTDLVREMIKWRTYLISPSLVEEVLMELPEVKEAVVLGLSDDEDGELVAAAVILEFGYENTDVNALEKQVNDLLPDHRKIRGGIFVFHQFPRSTVGKPVKDHILKEVLERRHNISQRRLSSE